MSVNKILEQVANEPGKNAKIEILAKNKGNAALQEAVRLAYEPTINFYIKKIPDYTAGMCSPQLTLTQALTALGDLSSRKVTGDAARNTLGWILQNCSVEDAKVVAKVVQRDLRAGFTDGTANKVWKNLVTEFDVMLSHKDISGIKFPAYAQLKSDGARCHMMLRNGEAMAFSRNGKPIELHGTFNAALAQLVNDGETLDGELLAMKDGKILDRKTGNGIVNKAVKGTITKAEADMLVFASWDIVDFTSTIPYKSRIERLTKQYQTSNQTKIHVLQTSIVNNKDEAQAFFEQCLAAGEEGAMIKNMNAVWVPKRSKDLGKMKAEEVADLVVVGIEEGTGKYVGMMGAAICETSDGKLHVNVGTGFSDEERKKGLKIGDIIEVMYNQTIQDKNGGPASLFLPRFLSVRFDKDKANKFSELK